MIEIVRDASCLSRLWGSSHNQMELLLGEPDQWGTSNNSVNSRVWVFGDVEFHFQNFGVYLVFSDRGSLVQGSGNLSIDPWIIQKGLSSRDLKAGLSTHSISFVEENLPYDSDEIRLTTESGATFAFTPALGDSDRVLSAWWVKK